MIKYEKKSSCLSLNNDLQNLIVHFSIYTFIEKKTFNYYLGNILLWVSNYFSACSHWQIFRYFTN